MAKGRSAEGMRRAEPFSWQPRPAPAAVMPRMMRYWDLLPDSAFLSKKTSEIYHKTESANKKSSPK
jgi:hypothetical protein